MKTHKLRILFWIPDIAVMAAIFMFSAEPAHESTDTSASVIETVLNTVCPDYKNMTFEEKSEIIDSLQYTVRKCAHASVYLLLSVCLFIPFTFYFKNPAAISLAAWLTATLYAATDELHQLFVDGRSCEFTDVLIDSGGAAFGILLSLTVLLLHRYRRKKRSVL